MTPDDQLLEIVARALMQERAPALAKNDEVWGEMVANHRMMATKFGSSYTEGRSLILDAFRDAQIAIETIRKCGRY